MLFENNFIKRPSKSTKCIYPNYKWNMFVVFWAVVVGGGYCDWHKTYVELIIYVFLIHYFLYCSMFGFFILCLC